LEMMDPGVIEAFRLMWGSFPEPALLVRDSREIIAVNEAAKTAGRVEGTICATYGGPEAHRHCLANRALATQQPAFVKRTSGGREIISYWLPLDGYPDLFVHFIIGVTIDYHAAPDNAGA
jgi:hypothetical protein